VIIIVDSDGLIGTSHINDKHYSKATKLLQNLTDHGAELIYPATVISEATAVLQIRLNTPETADAIMEYTKAGLFNIEAVNNEVLISAISFLDKNRSKHATLFDGVVAAIAQKYKADAIFSFDKFYKTKGFKLASEL